MYNTTFQDTVRLSALGMGNMRLPVQKEVEGNPIDMVAAQKMLDYAIAHGVNYFDTAYIYHSGASEAFLGSALAAYPRESYYLADKFNLLANPDYKAQFAQQLERLQTHYIDFYLLHALQDGNFMDYLNSGCIAYCEQLRKEGKIRYLGVSVHCSPAVFIKILDAHKWDFVQIQLNYYDWVYGDAKALYELAVARNLPVFVMEPVRGGTLASLTEEGEALLKSHAPQKSVASWALRWLMGLPQVAVVLSGMSDQAQMEDNIATFAAHNPLSGEEEADLQRACALLRQTISVACTACKYCCDNCPQNLDIPFLLSVYNDMKIGGEWRIGFLGGMEKDKLPSACIDCKNCMQYCPQGFDIPKYLSEMAILEEKI